MRAPAPGAVLLRLALVLLGLLLAGAACELALVVFGLPRFYEPHTTPKQFMFLSRPVDGTPLWVNRPDETITFVYDGDPRGYFGPGNAVHYRTNSQGFRGEELPNRGPEEGLRIVFLGDSFTFGSGVHFEDTYPERVEGILREEVVAEGVGVECTNLAIGGHNTVQALQVLRMHGLRQSPDAVVLGYFLNDAEPSIYEWDPAVGEPRRRPRTLDARMGVGDPRPPGTWIYRLRSAQLVWQRLENRRRGQRVIDHYRGVFSENSEGWRASREAMGKIAGLCRKRGIPCYVLVFPLLQDLGEEHPFRETYAGIARAAEEVGAIAVDLHRELEGRSAPDLWVHPVDHHPNEIVHGIAARILVERFVADGLLPVEALRE